MASPRPIPPKHAAGPAQLLLDQLLDEATDLLANARFDRVEPSLPRNSGALPLQRHVIRRHGVISARRHAAPLLAG
jgi:hypothetical protein